MDTDLILDNQAARAYTIKDLPPEEKPREKLAKYGPGALSIHELIAILLGTGTKKENVLAMSSRLLKEYGEKTIINQRDPKRLSKSLNIPLIKATQIIAALELGRRFFKPASGGALFLRTPEQVYEYLKDMRQLPKEHLRGLYLNAHYQLMHDEVISIGSLTSNIIHPREVFKPAFEYSSTALILAHNHPSGVSLPSEADISITKQLIEAGKILGIALLDHLIVTQKKFVSIPAEYN
ncbi:MAG: DNA repair protein RadC [Candidatus Liptonbacteria bacterium]